MSADKPVSLAERIAACCPCRHADGTLLDARDPHMCEKVCACILGSTPTLPAPACRQPIHTLEAEARELEQEKDWGLDRLAEYQARIDAAESRVAALTEVLRIVRGHAKGISTAVAALADEPRKETRDGD